MEAAKPVCREPQQTPNPLERSARSAVGQVLVQILFLYWLRRRI
jgi:hypothetical protein